MPPEAAELERLLEQSGALQRGHFQLSSGLHSPAYIQCARLFEDPRRARRVAAWLAAELSPFAPGSVVSPALGGMIIGHEVAASLGVPFRFAERAGGVMALRRGFALAPGEAVAVVEDVVTTGRSTMEAAAAATAWDARVVAIGAVIDRSREPLPFAVPFRALLRLNLPSYAPEVCPLCAQGMPADKPGSRPLPPRPR